MNVEGRERFFRAIAERIDVERVEEVHVFPAIRQGGRESGVAVVTLRPESPETEGDERIEDASQAGDLARADELSPAVGVEGTADTEHADAPAETDRIEAEADAEVMANAAPEAMDAPLPPAPPRRFTVLRAHYRLQLKGPDRGKWEVGVVEEADAPAATVDEVVRGVHERAGGWSVEGPEHLTGDEFRAALAEEPWSATR